LDPLDPVGQVGRRGVEPGGLAVEQPRSLAEKNRRQVEVVADQALGETLLDEVRAAGEAYVFLSSEVAGGSWPCRGSRHVRQR
jgi:hypothetical protein